MVHSVSSRVGRFSLALLAVTLIGGQALHASSLTVFKGKYGGKFTGVMTIAQGPSIREISSANTKVSASKKAAKFTIKGTLNNTGFVQTISLSSNGHATLSSVIPGGGSDFQNSASGTYQVHGKAVKISISNPGGIPGSMVVTINFINSGSTLCISSVIFQTDGDPVYTTVIGS